MRWADPSAWQSIHAAGSWSRMTWATLSGGLPVRHREGLTERRRILLDHHEPLTS